jgi:uncharacterized protein with HEPN domain
MRREELYLRDIFEAADAIGRFISGVARERFLADEQLQSGVLHKLTVIGEAASRLPREFRARHPDVEWGDVVGFRNIVVHEYFAVRWPTVWATASKEVPELKSRVAEILAREYPAARPG